MDNYKTYYDTADLIAKFLRDELTAEEEKALLLWRGENNVNEELFQKIIKNEHLGTELKSFRDAGHKAAWENIRKSVGLEQTEKPVPLFKRLYPYAAAILILMAVGLSVTNLVQKKSRITPLAFHQKDIQPGTNKAILTLANGSTIILDNSERRKIAGQRDIDTNRTHHGELVYLKKGGVLSAGNAFADVAIPTNIITTPRGGQYIVVLPDGTKAWLNAASSLKFPTAFPGAERRVELTGEAYFEVAKNAEKPFFVKTANQTVEVLGTHFNINSYTDENSTTTTLLEGSVRVTGNTGKSAIHLKPGQQSISDHQQIKINPNPNIDAAMAWKNGKFLFNNSDLKTIMRQLSRWYAVDVEYRGENTDKHYEGHISRAVPLSQILQILKTSGINFTISEGKIIVKS